MGKFLILGDVHIGAQISIGKSIPNSPLNSRIFDQLKLLDWTLYQAKENNCTDIIITGDIFEDSIPETYLISHFMKWLNKCSDTNICVHIIMGNHDFIKYGNEYHSALDIINESKIQGIYVYKNVKTIYIDNCAITLLPYNDRKTLECSKTSEALLKLKTIINNEIISDDYHKILIGHQAIKNSIYVGNEFDDLDNELFIEIDDLKSYDFVWMGHIHAPQIMNKLNPFVAHIGSMDKSSFSESDQRKHIIIFDSSSKNKFEKIYLPTRNIRHVSITVPEDILDSTEYAIDFIENLENLSESIIRIDFDLNNPNALPLSKNKIENHLLSKGVFNVCNITESKKSIRINKNEGNSSKIESINNKLHITNAVDLYSDLFIKEEEKEAFKKLAKDIISNIKK